MATKSKSTKDNGKPVVTLKKLSLERPATKTKKDIPIIRVEGDQIKEYNKAVADVKEAKEIQDEIKPAVLELGIPEILTINCGDPDNAVASVRLIDDTGAEAVVSFKDQYRAVSPQAAVDLLVAFGVKDVNDYLQEEIVPTFDTKAFYTADGKFNAELFVAVRDALQKVSAQFGLAGELIGKDKVVKPNANFHDLRFRRFSACQNEVLTEVLPNTVSVTAK